MNREAIVFGLSGVLFGVLVGWVIGSQRAVAPADVSRAAAPAAPAAGESSSQAKALDLRRVEELQSAARERSGDAAPRIELGNMYFDAERYDEAIRWYVDALRINANDPNVSTDLGVSYYYTNQPDRALAQFAHSLKVDPNHTKTMLNMGIVRAFGKQDLSGAAEAWQRVVALSPDSAEGRAARQALDSMKSAHPEVSGQTPPPPTTPPRNGSRP
jgi:cytochrome c-type biogenesis protein CcmH/NrfG